MTSWLPPRFPPLSAAFFPFLFLSPHQSFREVDNDACQAAFPVFPFFFLLTATRNRRAATPTSFFSLFFFPFRHGFACCIYGLGLPASSGSLFFRHFLLFPPSFSFFHGQSHRQRVPGLVFLSLPFSFFSPLSLSPRGDEAGEYAVSLFAPNTPSSFFPSGLRSGKCDSIYLATVP